MVAASIKVSLLLLLEPKHLSELMGLKSFISELPSLAEHNRPLTTGLCRPLSVLLTEKLVSSAP